MIFLLTALLFSLGIIVIFKLFPRFGISIPQAIVVNYFIAALLGFLSIGQMPSAEVYVENSFLNVAFVNGVLFIVVFHIFALSAEKAGVAITAVSSKMSVMIPVIAGAILFGEKFSFTKAIGVVLVMLSFYLVFKKEEGYKFNKSLFILPLLLFTGNGANDTILKFAQFHHITSANDYMQYLVIVFSVALMLGLPYLILLFIFGKVHFEMKHIVAGIVLGIFNWFSSLFFLKGLGSLEVSVFIPVFNAGLVSLAALTGMIVFREELSRINIIGILISLIAITLIAYAK